MPTLLTRDEFRRQVFLRDNNACVICEKTGQDAHHIMERRLFTDGGYYVDNGATLCVLHHLMAEKTELSCEDLRSHARIKEVILPEHLYSDERYDKWGNPFLPNGLRMRGELFYDESVQKVLADSLNQFTKYVRYPRTYHVPWSPGVTRDDRSLTYDTLTSWKGTHVVITEKMDGENTTMYRDYIHARSPHYTPAAWRDRIKALWASIQYEIPEGWRICGENLTVQHSIPYDGMPFFMVFSVWDSKNICLSWHETSEWAHLLGLEMVPTVWRGTWDKLETFRDEIRTIQENPDKHEGWVVRPVGEFPYRDFSRVVGKYVRANHVKTSHSWQRHLKFNPVA